MQCVNYIAKIIRHKKGYSESEGLNAKAYVLFTAF